MISRVLVTCCTMWVALAFVGGCGDDASPVNTPTDSTGPIERRIVCLSPAMTQIIEDLGYGDRVVGVSRWDFVAPGDTPIIGDLSTINYEKLLRLRPTDIAMQTTREGVPAQLSELAERRGWRIWRWPLEDHDSVLRAIHDPEGGVGRDNDSLSGMLGDTDAGRRLVDSVRGRLHAISRVTGARTKQNVLVVVSGENGVMAAAPNTFIDEMLGVAGGRNAITGSTVLYPMLDAEKLLAIAPDVVVYIPPHDPPRSLKLPESLEATVLTLADRRGLLPSSSMPLIAAQMAKLLYPEHADVIDAAVAGVEPIEVVPVGGESDE